MLEETAQTVPEGLIDLIRFDDVEVDYDLPPNKAFLATGCNHDWYIERSSKIPILGKGKIKRTVFLIDLGDLDSHAQLDEALVRYGYHFDLMATAALSYKYPDEQRKHKFASSHKDSEGNIYSLILNGDTSWRSIRYGKDGSDSWSGYLFAVVGN